MTTRTRKQDDLAGVRPGECHDPARRPLLQTAALLGRVLAAELVHHPHRTGRLAHPARSTPRSARIVPGQRRSGARVASSPSRDLDVPLGRELVGVAARRSPSGSRVLVAATAAAGAASSAAGQVGAAASRSAARYDDRRQPQLVRPRRRRPIARSRRSPAPGCSPPPRPAVWCRRGRAPDPVTSRAWRTGRRRRRTRRSHASASWKPAPTAWPCTAAIGDEIGPTPPAEAVLEGRDQVDQRAIVERELAASEVSPGTPQG